MPFLSINDKSWTVRVQHLPSNTSHEIHGSSLYDCVLSLTIDGEQKDYSFKGHELGESFEVKAANGKFIFQGTGSAFERRDGSRVWNCGAVEASKFPKWLPRFGDESFTPTDLLVGAGDRNGGYTFQFEGTVDQLLEVTDKAFAEVGRQRERRFDESGGTLVGYQPPNGKDSATLLIRTVGENRLITEVRFWDRDNP